MIDLYDTAGQEEVTFAKKEKRKIALIFFHLTNFFIFLE